MSEAERVSSTMRFRPSWSCPVYEREARGARRGIHVTRHPWPASPQRLRRGLETIGRRLRWLAYRWALEDYEADARETWAGVCRRHGVHPYAARRWLESRGMVGVDSRLAKGAGVAHKRGP